MSFFSKFKERETLLAIDIGTVSIKAGEFQFDDNGVTLVNYAIFNLRGQPDRLNGALQASSFKMSEELAAESLKKVISALKPKSKKAIFSLPAFNAFTTLVELPQMSNREVEKSIPFQSKQYIPAPLESVKVNWFKIGEREGGDGPMNQYMLVSVANSVIDRYTRVAEAAGLKAVDFEVENLSLARALTTEREEPTIVIDIGARSTSITIGTSGVMQFAAQTDFSGSSLTQVLANSLGITALRAEDLKIQRGLAGIGGEAGLSTLMTPMIDAIISEATRAIRNFYKSYSRPVRQVVLAGGGAKLLGATEYFSASLSLPALIAEPFAFIKHPPLSDPLIADVGPKFAVTVGLALNYHQGLQKK